MCECVYDLCGFITPPYSSVYNPRQHSNHYQLSPHSTHYYTTKKHTPEVIHHQPKEQFQLSTDDDNPYDERSSRTELTNLRETREVDLHIQIDESTPPFDAYHSKDVETVHSHSGEEGDTRQTLIDDYISTVPVQQKERDMWHIL